MSILRPSARADGRCGTQGPAEAAFPAELPGLTGVRFLLAAGVAFFHYHLVWGVDDMAWTSLLERSRLGLDVFFILSGFILTHVYQRQYAEGRYSHRRFLVARIARIYPMHLAALAVFVAMVLAGRLLGASFDGANYPWGDLGRTVLLVQAWTPDPRPNLWNGPSWSLSAEWFAYLLFPAFAWIGLKLGRRPVVLLALATALFVALDAVYLSAYGRILPRAEDGLGVLRIVPEFLYGVGLYRLGERLTVDRRSAVAGAVAAAAAFLALMHFGADDRLIVLAAGPLVLSLALLSKGGADAGLARPSMLLLGEASFALYLLHMPILIAWRHAAGLLTGRPLQQAMPLAEVLLVFAVTIVAAVAAHLLWERPARDWIRRRADRLWPTQTCGEARPAVG